MSGASPCVPRGQQKKYIPFWNENLRKLKEIREEAGQKTYVTRL
ncbi:hypothetical protein NPIL_294081, partial [Nephila pilipes]